MYTVRQFYISQSDAEKVANAKGKVSVKLHETEHKGYHLAPFNLTAAQVKKITNSKRKAHSITLSHAQVKSLFKKGRGDGEQEGTGWLSDFWSGVKYGFTLPFKGANYALKKTGLKDLVKSGAKAVGTAALSTTPVGPLAPIVASAGVEGIDYAVESLGDDFSLPQTGRGILMSDLDNCPLMPQRLKNKYKKQLKQIGEGLDLYTGKRGIHLGEGLSSSNRHMGSGLTTSNRGTRRPQRGGSVNASFHNNELM